MIASESSSERVKGIPAAGQEQTNSRGPSGGSGHSQYECCEWPFPRLAPLPTSSGDFDPLAPIHPEPLLTFVALVLLANWAIPTVVCWLRSFTGGHLRSSLLVEKMNKVWIDRSNKEIDVVGIVGETAGSCERECRGGLSDTV